MKEKDLEKCLDNLIIKGLIQEAEQDNAEFEVAMRKMSDEDFLALIFDTREEPTTECIHLTKGQPIFNNEPSDMLSEAATLSISEGFACNSSDDSADWGGPILLNKPEPSKYRLKGWKVWATAIASVAAILLIVFVPAHMDMESRLCESALLASETYMDPSRGIDISSMKKNEVKAMLPELEKQYSISLKQYRNQSIGIVGEQIGDIDDIEYYTKHLTPQESGLDLVQAYLRLSQKDKAVKVLKELSESDSEPEFIGYCQKMLEILE